MEFVILFYVIMTFLLWYYTYQLVRNNQVFKIRKVWIDNDDDRWDYYSYDFMFDPKKHNWYGLRFPRDSHYPPKEVNTNN